MKLALVTETFFPSPIAGTDRAVADLAAGLIARGHAVTLITYAAPKDEHPLPGGAIEQIDGGLDRRGKSNIHTARGTRRFATWAEQTLTRGGFDATLAFGLTVPADVVLPVRGALLDWIAHTGLRRTAHFATRLRQERRVMRNPRVRTFAAPCPAIARRMAHHGTPESKVRMIPYGVAQPETDETQRQALRERVRRLWNLPNDAVVLLYPGNDHGMEGLAPLLHAAKALPTDSPVRLVACGKLVSEYVLLAEDLALADRLRWVGPSDRKDAIHAAADAVVLPAAYAAINRSTLEALSHGLPVIGSPRDGAAAWIAHPADGESQASPAGIVLPEKFDTDAITKAIQRMTAVETRREFAAACATLDDRLRLERHVDAIERLLIDAASS